MPVVALPDPPVGFALPAICLVTGGTEGVRLQPVPVGTWDPSERVMLPVTEQGLAAIVGRIRGAQAIVAGSMVLTVLSMTSLGWVLPWVGNARYLSLVICVFGWVVARVHRHGTLYSVSVRNGVRVLFVPLTEPAEALRDAVRRAELPPDFRRQLASAERLAALNEGNHPLAD